MKKIPAATKALLLNLRARLPPSCRQRFGEVIARELGKLEMENPLKYAVAGAAVGVVLDLLPLGRVSVFSTPTTSLAFGGSILLLASRHS